MSTSPGSTSSSSPSPSTNASASGSDETIAVFDLDGTITTRDTTAAFLLGYLREHPRRLARCVPLLISTAGFAAGFVDNAALKAAAVRAILGGASRDEIAAWTERFVPWCLDALVRPVARTRIEAHRSARHHLILASASLDLHVVPIGKALGFAEVICTKVAWTRGQRISGELEGGNVRSDKKLAEVQRAVALKESAPRSARVIAYSDHPADLPLLRWADQAVAVNPTRQLAAAAAIEGIPVEDWGRP
ncbi:MAG TPA: HAD-IB family hydrolase [Stellaceae bacterium]|nr:HAD-IB family hydrolase [Stellaceae bacterium]